LDESSLEERLDRIERLLESLLAKVNDIERSLGLTSEELMLATMLANTFGLSAIEAVRAALRVKRALSRLKIVDPISRAILEVLSKGEWMSISEITRAVRLVRGRASRGVIRDRVKKLEEMGIVEVKRESNKTLVRLRE
jgi:DNA-binding transcriptional ArsR family regulator